MFTTQSPNDEPKGYNPATCREDSSDLTQHRRLDLHAGYGFGADGDRFTATPELGLGLSDTGREYRLGWRLTLAEAGPTAFEFVLDATRREHDNAAAAPQHTLGLRMTSGW